MISVIILLWFLGIKTLLLINKMQCDFSGRKAAKEAEADALESQIPHLKDNEAIQKFFLQEVQLGEEMLSKGDITNGVEHLANAVAVCGQPQQLLNVLSSTLPPKVFEMLLQRLTVLNAGRQVIMRM